MNLNLAYREKLREGQRIGEEIGKKNALEQTARRMLSSQKISVEDISSFTGLSIDEIKALQ